MVEDVSGYVRVPLVLVNFLGLLVSLVAFLTALYTLSARRVPPSSPSRSFVVVLIQRPEIPALVLSSAGFVTASFGILGALRENICFLTVYIRLMVVVVILLLVGSALPFALPSVARGYVQQTVSRDLIAAYRDSAALSGFVDWMQARYKCCGGSPEGFRDWNLNPYFACDGHNPSRERCYVPASCCRRNDSSESLPPLHCGSNVLQASFFCFYSGGKRYASLSERIPSRTRWYTQPRE